MRRLFGTDGVRGIAGEFLTVELAMKIGRATATVLSSGSRYRPLVLVGTDTRISSDMLSSALAAGLCSVGADVIDIGVLPTPAVAYLTGKYRADAGIVISASHNSFEYNGIKIFSSDGFKLPDALEEQIEDIVLDAASSPALAPSHKIGRVRREENAAADYIDYLRRTAFNDLCGLSVAIDCAAGAASVTAEALFSSLGAKCHMLADKPNGLNINDGCGSTHPEALQKYVVDNGLDVGVAFDGDADRCFCVDDKGNLVDGDVIMAILSKDMKERGVLRENTVVGTVMSNLGFIKFCEENGIRFISAKVGDRYVLEIMNQEGYSFGGEQSGHVIMRDYATTGDGQLTALQLLSLLKREKKPFSVLASVMRRYPQCLVNIKTTPEGKLAFYTDKDVARILKEAEAQLEGRGRIVVRPSGTEPLLRVMVESETEEETRRVAEETAESIRICLSAYEG